MAISGYDPHNCVKLAQLKGLKLNGYGAAKNYPTNSDTPQIGGFVKTDESSLGHLAVVIGVTSDSIKIEESNYLKTSLDQRTIKLDDPRIVGYID